MQQLQSSLFIEPFPIDHAGLHCSNEARVAIGVDTSLINQIQLAVGLCPREKNENRSLVRKSQQTK